MATLEAGCISKRAAAMELMTAGKNQDAAEAFIQWAEATTNDFPPVDASTNAAVFIQHFKRRDEAMALVTKIWLVPMLESAELDLFKEVGMKASVLENADK